MPENNFEKQVQEIFSEMRLKPSADVWPKVHERIKKDNNRRWALLWIPAALLLLSAGGYWLLGPSEQANNSHQLTNTNTVVNEKTANDPSLQKQSSPGNNTAVTENAKPAQPTGKQVTAATNGPENKASVNNEAVSAPGEANTANSKETSAENDNKVVISEGIAKQQQKNLVANKKVDNNIISNPSKFPKAFDKQFKAKESLSASQNNKSEKVQTVTDAGLNEERTDASLTASLQSVAANEIPGLYSKEHLQNTPLNKNLAPAIKLARKKTWEFGVSAGAGISALGKGLSKDLFAEKTLENNRLATVDNYPIAPNPLPSSGNITDYQNLVGNGSMAAALPPPASPVKSGFSFTIGGFSKWHVSPKFALTGGLEYLHYTTRREVGKAISYDVLNQAPNQYANVRFAGSYSTSAAASSNNSMYTNEYHYLQVPIGFEWQLNKVNHLPVMLNAGLSVGYMMNTNAVHYGTSTGLYYQDKKLFNDLQGGLYAGIQVKLFERTRMPLYVGPVVQYNYTSLTKNSSDSKQNFMYAGLKLQWVLATAK